MDSQKICFISHNATRTGAPIVLLNFVRWIKANHPQHYIEVLLLEDGELKKDFEQVCKVKLMPQRMHYSLIKKMLIKLTGKDFIRKNFLKKYEEFDLLFFNTIASLKIIPFIKKSKTATMVAWLHEQPLSIYSWYKDYFTPGNFVLFDKVLCVSTQTIEHLHALGWIDLNKIFLAHPFIDEQNNVNKNEIAKEVMKPGFVVGGCGLQDWRKGPDIFLQIANNICKSHPESDIRFEWVGAESSMTAGLQYEQEKFGLTDKSIFIGSRQNMKEWFNSIDIFLLTSREDPFPLVVLEAIAAGIPVLCFEGIGDIEKIIETIPENVIPYNRIDLFVDRVMYYKTNPAQQQTEKKQLRIILEKYKLDNGATKLWSELSNPLIPIEKSPKSSN